MLSFKEFLEATAYDGLTFGLEIEIPVTRGDLNLDGVLKSIKTHLGWSWDVEQTCMPGIEIKSKPRPIDDTNLKALEIDLDNIKSAFKANNIQIISKPKECATHIHVGGLDLQTRIKIAHIWVKGLQDLHMPLISPERRELLQGTGTSYMKRVRGISQYQTLPTKPATTKLGKFIQNTVTSLKNFLGMDKYVGHDKFYSLSPRGGLGTLEFRTKESTLDGRHLGDLIRMIAAVASSVDRLYGQEVTGRKVAKELLKQGIEKERIRSAYR